MCARVHTHTHTHTHREHTHTLMPITLQEPSEMSTAPLLGTELTVLYDFEAQDKAELSVCAGQTVTLRCPSDRIGCPEWWLVECPHGTGYVPANFLDYHGNT